jgi:hypothetical protein
VLEYLEWLPLLMIWHALCVVRRFVYHIQVPNRLWQELEYFSNTVSVTNVSKPSEI